MNRRQYTHKALDPMHVAEITVGELPTVLASAGTLLNASATGLLIEWVVYLHLTDNSRAGECDKMVSFQHRERGHHRGTESVVLPTPPRYSRVDLPHDSCLVARPSQGRMSQDLQAG
jgi:hypothetical protein